MIKEASRGSFSRREMLARSMQLAGLAVPWAAGVGQVGPRHEAGGADPFGGIPVRVAAPGGFFRVQKIGNRWLFVTPAGNAFWMFGVYGVNYADGGKLAQETFKTKFKGDQFAFATHALRRLKLWGFNTIGLYSSPYALPVPTNSRGEANSVKMPFIRNLNVAWYGTTGHWHYTPEPVKTLLAGAVDPDIYRGGWPGHVIDVFDPKFESIARAAAAELPDSERRAIFTKNGPNGGTPHPSLVNEPWLLGTSMGDSDYLFGFGPGSEFPGQDGAIHPHLGWVVAVTKPTQTDNELVGRVFGKPITITYADTTVYSKAAWRDYLKKKYSTVEALNAAWHSSYTSFDSDGGWGAGKGLMDENGRNRWIGNDYEKLSTASPKVVEDLNAFLEIFAERFFKVMHDAIKAATPNHMVFGPAILNSHRGLTRREILRAAGRYCDAVEVTYDEEHPELLGMTYSEAKKPLFVYMLLRANPDSDLYAYPQRGPTARANQAERAASYAKQVNTAFSFSMPDQTHPIIGIDWWEYMDKWGDKGNFGLVSLRDNAYDGEEATRAAGTDEWGYPTGGEGRDYGDFITTVRQTNVALVERLREELAHSNAK